MVVAKSPTYVQRPIPTLFKAAPRTLMNKILNTIAPTTDMNYGATTRKSLTHSLLVITSYDYCGAKFVLPIGYSYSFHRIWRFELCLLTLPPRIAVTSAPLRSLYDYNNIIARVRVRVRVRIACNYTNRGVHRASVRVRV